MNAEEMKYRFITNEREDALKSLEFTAVLLPKVLDDTYNWKWVIITFHNAIQSLMVSALTYSHGLYVLPEKRMKQWLDAFLNETDTPEDYLDSFPNLFTKVKSAQYMTQYITSKVFESNSDIDDSMKRLNHYRNTFIHFLPKTFGFIANGMPNHILNCMVLANFLALESGNIQWWEDGQEERYRGASGKVEDESKKLADYYLKLINTPNQV